MPQPDWVGCSERKNHNAPEAIGSCLGDGLGEGGRGGKTKANSL